MAYTKEDLEGKDISELRTIARQFGINPAGRTVGHLTMAIIKESKAHEGTATAASGPPAPRRRAAPVPEPEVEDDDADDVPTTNESEEDDEPEYEEEETPMKPATVNANNELLRSIAHAILALLGENVPCEGMVTVEVEEPTKAPPPVVEKKAVPAEAPAEKRGRGRPKKDAAPPPPPPPPPPAPEPEEEEDEVDEDDAEMGDELDIQKDDVLKADFATLVAWAKIINKNGLGPVKCEGTKEKELRGAILEIVEAAGDEDEGEQKAWPEWVDVGVRVEAHVEGEGWIKAVIKEVGDSIKVELFDGDMVEIEDPADLKPAPSKTPRERKKA